MPNSWLLPIGRLGVVIQCGLAATALSPGFRDSYPVERLPSSSGSRGRSR